MRRGAQQQDERGQHDSAADDERRHEHDQPLPERNGGDHGYTVTSGTSTPPGYPAEVPDTAGETNYTSGEDYVVEFLGYRFCFNAFDFEQRVVAAAVKLGLVEVNELDEEETSDLVALAAQGVIDAPQSRLGRYLTRNWERLSLVHGESLVYWLRKLIFRGAWLDHQVKRGALEIVWDESEAEFAYQHPGGGRPLLELAPVPSWHELQYKP